MTFARLVEVRPQVPGKLDASLQLVVRTATYSHLGDHVI
jgi:hypothetical protein